MKKIDKFLNQIKNIELQTYLKEILGFYLPLTLELPKLRDNSEFMQEEVKAVSASGTTDVATASDKITEKKIQTAIEKLGYNWQFWGEESSKRDEKIDKSKEYIFITDPIEGTNNFKFRNDNQWGSVVALVHTESVMPVIGIVSHPCKNKFYIGIRGNGTYILEFKQNFELLSYQLMLAEPEYSEFTYNHSPHFEQNLIDRVSKFYRLKINNNKLIDDPKFPERERVKLRGPDGENVDFIDPESGALEAVRNRGTICFKTSNEMAAVFVILEEIGGKVTDGKGKPWSLGINSMISARTPKDYEYLKTIYDMC